MEIKPYPENSNYLVRVDGIIVSKKTGKPMKPQTVTHGYQYLRLGRKGGYKAVHRLVAETWLPNPNNLSDVNHKDGDKTNNRLENLEWVTHSNNAIHAVKQGLTSGKLSQSDVSEIKIRLRQGDKQADLAKEFGVTKSMIHYIATGHSWSYVS